MPDQNGRHCSSVVWMETNKRAKQLLRLSEADFSHAVQERSAGVLGKMEPNSKRQSFPIISQIADKIAVSNCYLIAETAHVVPPIGAQGLNMSLADIRWLYEHADEILNADQSAAYQKARYGDMQLRKQGIDVLNRAAKTENQNLRNLRLQGLKALNGITPMRQAAMKKGLGI